MQTQTDTRGTQGRSRKPRDSQNGHTIILKTSINKKQRLAFELITGKIVYGHVSQFDNYTITIIQEAGLGCEPRPRTFFKHAIVSFYPSEA